MSADQERAVAEALRPCASEMYWSASLLDHVSRIAVEALRNHLTGEDLGDSSMSQTSLLSDGAER